MTSWREDPPTEGTGAGEVEGESLEPGDGVPLVFTEGFVGTKVLGLVYCAQRIPYGLQRALKSQSESRSEIQSDPRTYGRYRIQVVER